MSVYTLGVSVGGTETAGPLCRVSARHGIALEEEKSSEDDPVLSLRGHFNVEGLKERIAFTVAPTRVFREKKEEHLN